MPTSGCLPDPERADGHGLLAQGQTGHGPSHLRHHVAPANKHRLVSAICFVISGCNEVVAKVMFLLVCVILFRGGGGSASVHAGIPPPGKEAPPGSRHPPRKEAPPREGGTPC